MNGLQPWQLEAPIRILWNHTNTPKGTEDSGTPLDISRAQATVDPKGLSPLGIPGPRDEAVKEYGEWQVWQVTHDTRKTAFRQVCEVMLENSLDLEQVYKGQGPDLFIAKRIKMGIARCFVEDIRRWVEA
ncbi:hypothetical protein N7468_003627 [Penicillium chermesinum]|uniref:Uncharacterized protein n=1 Tax=Penicillium chermesinum TaxID=63820 RepID=A0A9W9P9E5_9EURO|nr:uncharacterized protein N7468_003627 [Penicillium chermesinum]KAJ5239008.1 hypothetical protein N7468_003627 [Penicillium chermesinum]KAJ6164652.1 hypothetical protein N7470_003324 [Penicillium chermesinum]